MCYSLRSRLIGPQSAITYAGRAGGGAGIDGESGQADSDPQMRDRRRVEERARIKAENKRSRNIDKTLKAEKREYKQTHRLLLLGEWIIYGAPSLSFNLAPPAPGKQVHPLA